MDKLLIVSTCGTSLLSNGASADDRLWLTRVANETKVGKDLLDPIVLDRRQRLASADDATRRRMSAELNGIGAVLDKWNPSQCSHLLVHTDTALGRAAADLVGGCLGNRAALVSAGGLRTNDLGSFRAALADLTKMLDETVQQYRKQRWFVVFNLTGGFKSLNGYLQTLGMISADRCVFLFEGAPELMEIPRLPVRLSEAEDLQQHLTVFRRLSVDYAVKTTDVRGVPESLLMEGENLVTTSVLGDVAWARHRKGLLAEKVMDPLSTKVRVAESVVRSFRDLEPLQRVQVNEALDEFSSYRDTGRRLTKSRTFKQLQGPVAGSTHELYVWSDGKAGRLFGHFDGDVFVFDSLSYHL